MIVRREALRPIDFGGLRIVDYTAERDLGSSLAVIEVPPAARHAEAWSKRSDKYYLVTQGEVRFVLDGRVHDLGEGDFCCVRCGQHFSYSNERSRMATLMLVHTPSFRLDQEVFVGAE
ncbi:MAG TPA: cupin domain-containing protein [Steroidobacteraceae bacterium]